MNTMSMLVSFACAVLMIGLIFFSVVLVKILRILKTTERIAVRIFELQKEQSNERKRRERMESRR